MIWLRHDEGSQKTKWLLGFSIFWLAISFLLLQFIALGVFGFLFILFLSQDLYYRYVGKGLELTNKKRRTRVLQGGESFFEFTFQNNGLPIWNATIRIVFQDVVVPKSHFEKQNSEFIEAEVPFFIGHKETVTVRVPVQGRSRGLARIKKLELLIPHPFAQGSVTLDYKPFLLQEIIVYPKISVVEERENPAELKPGHFEMKGSLFKDVYTPVGTKDYVVGDQFQHINWKASARLQKLQTKVFTEVANQSVLFVVNVANHYSIVHDLDELMEALSSRIDSYYKKGIPFALAINVRAYGKSPYLYLPVGTGQNQRQKALELLSIVSKNDSTIPFSAMLRHVEMHFGIPVSVHLHSKEVEKDKHIIANWSRKTNLLINSGEEEGDYLWKQKMSHSS